MMRAGLTIAAAFFAIASFASAGANEGWPHWRDPSGLLSFAYPTGWHVNPMRSHTEGAIRMVAGSATYECQIWSLPRQSTLTQTPDEVIARYSQPLSPGDWAETVHELPEFAANLVVTARGIETNAGWPVQRVELAADHHRARATLQGRPGRELLSICQSYDGQDRSEIFAAIERSITMGER